MVLYEPSCLKYSNEKTFEHVYDFLIAVGLLIVPAVSMNSLNSIIVY
jgi:hypothetical protein